jgi:hypothetical protein
VTDHRRRFPPPWSLRSSADSRAMPSGTYHNGDAFEHLADPVAAIVARRASRALA